MGKKRNNNFFFFYKTRLKEGTDKQMDGQRRCEAASAGTLD